MQRHRPAADSGMIRRPTIFFIRLAAALVAVAAMLFYPSLASDSHSSGLREIAVATSSLLETAHGHSHDDGAENGDPSQGGSHHHADHSHEKLDLVVAVSLDLAGPRAAVGVEAVRPLTGKGPRGPDRPPRAFPLI